MSINTYLGMFSLFVFTMDLYISSILGLLTFYVLLEFTNLAMNCGTDPLPYINKPSMVRRLVSIEVINKTCN